MIFFSNEDKLAVRVNLADPAKHLVTNDLSLTTLTHANGL